MIKITIRKDKFDYKGIRSEGHANNGSPDKKIICASVSALIQAAIQGIINLSEKDDYTVKHGYLSVMVLDDISSDQQKKANIILETIEMGIEAIRYLHQEHISIYYEESGAHEKD